MLVMLNTINLTSPNVISVAYSTFVVEVYLAFLPLCGSTYSPKLNARDFYNWFEDPGVVTYVFRIHAV
jgi:hypothetical protein